LTLRSKVKVTVGVDIHVDVRWYWYDCSILFNVYEYSMRYRTLGLLLHVAADC